MANRPVLTIEKTFLQKVLNMIGISALLLALAYVIINWSNVAESVPYHFDFTGEPDAWGSKWMVLILPVLGILLWTGLSFIEPFPHTFNYVVKINEGNAERQYYYAVTLIRLIKNEIALLFALLTPSIVQISNGQEDQLQFWIVPVFLVILFGTILIYFIKSLRWR